jgi:hypothetical protein
MGSSKRRGCRHKIVFRKKKHGVVLMTYEDSDTQYPYDWECDTRGSEEFYDDNDLRNEEVNDL